MQTDLVLALFATTIVLFLIYTATAIIGLRHLNSALNHRARYGNLPDGYRALVAVNTVSFILAVACFLTAAYKFFA